MGKAGEPSQVWPGASPDTRYQIPDSYITSSQQPLPPPIKNKSSRAGCLALPAHGSASRGTRERLIGELWGFCGGGLRAT